MTTGLPTLDRELKRAESVIDSAVDVMRITGSEKPCEVEDAADRKLMCRDTDNHLATLELLLSCGCVTYVCDNAGELMSKIGTPYAMRRPGLRAMRLVCDDHPDVKKITVVTSERIRG